MVVVLDASAAVELLLGTPAGTRVSRSLRGNPVIAPAHLDAEVVSALGRLGRDGRLGADAIATRLRTLARAPTRRVGLPPLLLDAFDLRDNVALRDALYVALARRVEGTLITADRSLSRAPDLGIAVLVVAP